jgi:hypothetical protein
LLERIAAAAETELQDDTLLREQLLEAEMRRELGEITEAEFADIERDILARIRETKGGQPGPIAMSSGDKVTRVEIETFDSDR